MKFPATLIAGVVSVFVSSDGVFADSAADPCEGLRNQLRIAAAAKMDELKRVFAPHFARQNQELIQAPGGIGSKQREEIERDLDYVRKVVANPTAASLEAKEYAADAVERIAKSMVPAMSAANDRFRKLVCPKGRAKALPLSDVRYDDFRNRKKNAEFKIGVWRWVRPKGQHQDVEKASAETNSDVYGCVEKSGGWSSTADFPVPFAQWADLRAMYRPDHPEDAEILISMCTATYVENTRVVSCSTYDLLRGSFLNGSIEDSFKSPAIVKNLSEDPRGESVRQHGPRPSRLLPHMPDEVINMAPGSGWHAVDGLQGLLNDITTFKLDESLSFLWKGMAEYVEANLPGDCRKKFAWQASPGVQEEAGVARKADAPSCGGRETAAGAAVSRD